MARSVWPHGQDATSLIPYHTYIIFIIYNCTYIIFIIYNLNKK